MVILALTWPILGATCCQLGPSWAHLGPMFAPTSPRISTKWHQKPQEAQPNTPRLPRGLPKGSQGRPWSSNLHGFGLDVGPHLPVRLFNLYFNSSWPSCLKFGTVAAWYAQRTAYLKSHFNKPNTTYTYMCIHMMLYVYVYIYIYIQTYTHVDVGGLSRYFS